jgi:cell division protein FtsB
MADFAADLCKIVSEKKLTRVAGKGGKKRKLGAKGSAVFGTASSSPGGASSSQGASKMTSTATVQKTRHARDDIQVVDLEMEKPFLLPKVVSDKSFLDKNPVQVAAVEKEAILGADEETGRDRILEDSARLLRLLETVLVLHEDRGSRINDNEKLKAINAKLKAENMKLENEVVDLRGKKENFVAQAKENRELKEELAKLEEEIKLLKSAMAPAVDETENTRGLSTRAEFFARVRKLGDSCLLG